MFTIGCTGEAAAASLTIDLITYQRPFLAVPRDGQMIRLTRHPVADRRLALPAETDRAAQLLRTLLLRRDRGGGVGPRERGTLVVWKQRAWIGRALRD